MCFHTRIKTHTKAAHERLENHPRMAAYSKGAQSAEEYRNVVRQLGIFWNRATPATRLLAEPFHTFLTAYREALHADAAASFEKQSPVNYDEIAFFYLLVGSSHGARYMLAKRTDSHPQSHLEVLAQQGQPLWRDFVREHLDSTPAEREHIVLDASIQMFDDLYIAIDN